MTKRLFFLFILLFAHSVSALPQAWINEIHYDNAGADRNEFVEVVVKDPEHWYLGDLVLYMYNGYDGVQYCLDSIDEFELGDRESNYQFYTWYQRGIQNDTEGMILVFKDTLVDILAYEGSFLGTLIPAEGLLFPDLGVKETGYGPDTCSIYLSAMPGSDWVYGSATPGQLNPGQSLPDTPLPVIIEEFKGVYMNDAVHLSWCTESESAVCAYHLFRNNILIASLQGQGHTSSRTNYSFIDHDVSRNEHYEYMLKEIHFSGSSTIVKTLNIHTYCPKDFGLGSPFPNPANPESKIKIDMFKDTHLELDIYDLKGKHVKNTHKGFLNKGLYEFLLNMHDLPSGKYIVRCQSDYQVESFEITLLK